MNQVFSSDQLAEWQTDETLVEWKIVFEYEKILIALFVCLGGCALLHAQGFPQSRIVTDTIYSEVLQAKRAYTVFYR